MAFLAQFARAVMQLKADPMQKVLRVSQIIAVLCSAFLCAAGGILLLHALRSVDKVNLDLDEAHRVLLEAGLTAREARQASAKEVAYLDQWNSGIGQTLKNANALLVSSRNTVDETGKAEAELVRATKETMAATQTAIAGLQPLENQTTTEIASLNKATLDLDALVTNPAIPETMVALKETAVHGAETSKHIDGTTADVQTWVHEQTHPPVLMRVWAALLDVAKVMSPLF